MRKETMEVMRKYKIFTSHFGDPLAVIPRTEMERLCEYVTSLEAENARLKRWMEFLVTDLIDVANDYNAPMSDCRMCDYIRFCECKPDQCEPIHEMCEAAVLKSCEPRGE